MSLIKIAIVDDHQIVIDGLQLLLESAPQVQVVSVATNGFELLEQLQKKIIDPDILILDLMMPVISGYEFSLIMKKEFPHVKVMILSMNLDGKVVGELIENAAIEGFLSKSISKKELIAAIEKVYEGGQYFSEEVIKELEKYAKIENQREEFRLSARELEVIGLIAKGCTNKQIAAHLFLSEKTVETHRKNIFRKTQTHNVGSLLDKVNRFRLLS